MTELSNRTSGGAVLSSFDYSYDNVGNRTGLVEANGNRVTWSYDNTDQLTRERRSGIVGVGDVVGDQLKSQLNI